MPAVCRISHIELNVSDYKKSVAFYSMVLTALGWRRLVLAKSHATFTDGVLKIVLCPTDKTHVPAGFHRKRTGLNHLALAVGGREDVDRFYTDIMQPNGLVPLYGSPMGDGSYYAVFFEDPDRMKIEIVAAPGYCEEGHYTNQFASDFTA